MVNLLEKIIDYYLTRSIKNKVILLFISSGLYLVMQSIFGMIFEEWLKNQLGIKIPNFTILGLFFTFIGSLILYHDIKYSFLPSMFNTTKTSRCIYLEGKTYQFIFDTKMRCSPTIFISKPTYSENMPTIKKLDENGFVVKFEEDKNISEIQFSADAWEGLNLRQKSLLQNSAPKLA